MKLKRMLALVTGIAMILSVITSGHASDEQLLVVCGGDEETMILCPIGDEENVALWSSPCGNGVCESFEDCSTCPSDCGDCISTSSNPGNGNGVADSIENVSENGITGLFVFPGIVGAGMWQWWPFILVGLFCVLFAVYMACSIKKGKSPKETLLFWKKHRRVLYG